MAVCGPACRGHFDSYSLSSCVCVSLCLLIITAQTTLSSSAPSRMETMQPLSQSPTTNKTQGPCRQRPVKLRNACNACCSAKVKCSGERTGCTRCRANGSSCLYLESRAGKVPGIRAKKKHSHSQALEDYRADGTPSNENSPSDRGNAFPDIDGSAATTDPVSWCDWNFDGTELDTNSPQEPSIEVAPHILRKESSVSHSSQVVSSTPGVYEASVENHSLADLELNFRDADASVLEQHFQLPETLIAPLPLGTRPRDGEDSQCFLECCHLLRDLEDIIDGELKTSKVALGYIKHALDQLSKFIEAQQQAKNLRCRMLFATLMYQVIELFEICLSAAMAEKDRLRNRTSGRSGLLGIGDYGVEAEEQLAIRTQAMHREAMHATKILEKLKELAVIDTGQSIPHSQSQAIGGYHHADLQLRLGEIARRLAAA
ncbi:hypothetical protein F5B22DRAFT_605865 [Xylaria bambusicola]|uniref:uncharacterized protein n=1 Tax=Xylaria bambusicola TaxID=326684 RepID=UPI0020077271|nr:uncharacterized protein F5B22DRAFT_605865 [Xylaria bambusicola]KAI0517012.1 hypothetical protein F5B22DRAFT_605865 [Xylaria bambusicola]